MKIFLIFSVLLGLSSARHDASTQLYDLVFNKKWSHAQDLGGVVVRAFECHDGELAPPGAPLKDRAVLKEFLDFDPNAKIPQFVSGGVWLRGDAAIPGSLIPKYVDKGDTQTCWVGIL